MKVQFIKQPGGALFPANDAESDRMKRFKNNEMYEVEIKTSRNPAFHRKVWAFFNFCFQYWSAENAGLEFQDEHKQLDTFRRNLTVLAGFKEVTYTISGTMRVEAKSIAYGNMEQEEFERCYSALINAALKHVFGSTKDQNIINQLWDFF